MAPKRKPAAAADAIAKAASAESEENPPAKRSSRSRVGGRAARHDDGAPAPAAAVKSKEKPPARRDATSRAGAKADAGEGVGTAAKAAKSVANTEEKSVAKRKAAAKRDTAADDDGAGAAAKPSSEAEKPTELATHTEFFLVKDEPSDFAIEDFDKEKDQTASWDGVRNYTARNVMRQMRKGNQVLFYRSGKHEPGVVGLTEVVKDPYPDHTSWDPKSKGYDPKSTPDEPRWFMVDLKLKRKFEHAVSLQTLKKYKDAELEGLALLRIGRLSVMPVTEEQFEFIIGLAEHGENAESS